MILQNTLNEILQHFEQFSHKDKRKASFEIIIS